MSLSKRIAASRLDYQDHREKAKIPTMREFLIEAWNNVLHPSETLEIDNAWYIDLICEWLTVITVGTLIRRGNLQDANRLLKPFDLTVETIDPWLKEVKELLINISPRCIKSTLVTTCFPCWEWLVMPWLSYLCMSYDQALASDHNDDRRKIIVSEWYQKKSGGMHLSGTKNRLTEFQNSHQGLMVARGLLSGVTGGGGMRLIFDDPNDPNKVESDLIRETTAKSFRDYSVTRRNDQKIAAVVVVQQRTHSSDISGIIQSEFSDYQQVVIAMEAEDHIIIEFPLSKRTIVREPGDLMHEDRFDADTCNKLRANPMLWAGRYQQRPNLAGGGIFKIRNWRLYLDLPNCDRSILSVDSAFKETKNSDFVVIGVIKQRLNVREQLMPDGESYAQHEYYIPYRWRARADAVATEQEIQKTSKNYPECTLKVIEDKANGSSIISHLQSVMTGLIAYNPGRDSKEARASAIQEIQSRGDVLFPIANEHRDALKAMGRATITIGEWWDLYPPDHESNAEYAPVGKWVKDFLNEAALFPAAHNDDQVDMLTQGINYLESMPSPTGWCGFGGDSINEAAQQNILS